MRTEYILFSSLCNKCLDIWYMGLFLYFCPESCKIRCRSKLVEVKFFVKGHCGVAPSEYLSCFQLFICGCNFG